MNIFHVLNESNENIMEYYSPPMQMPMQQPMAFPSMGMMPQRPISMPTKSSEKKEKKDDDDSTEDFLIKLLAVAGLGGGATLAYQHLNKPSVGEEIAGTGLEFAKFGMPFAKDYIAHAADEYSRKSETIKDKALKQKYAEMHQKQVDDTLKIPAISKHVGAAIRDKNHPLHGLLGTATEMAAQPKPGFFQNIRGFFGGA